MLWVFYSITFRNIVIEKLKLFVKTLEVFVIKKKREKGPWYIISDMVHPRSLLSFFLRLEPSQSSFLRLFLPFFITLSLVLLSQPHLPLSFPLNLVSRPLLAVLSLAQRHPPSQPLVFRQLCNAVVLVLISQNKLLSQVSSFSYVLRRT